MKLSTITWIIGVVFLIGLLGWAVSRVANKSTATQADNSYRGDFQK